MLDLESLSMLLPSARNASVEGVGCVAVFGRNRRYQTALIHLVRAIRLQHFVIREGLLLLVPAIDRDVLALLQSGQEHVR